MRDLCLSKGLDITEIEQLSQTIATKKRIRRGEMLYRAGEKFVGFYAIRLGHLKSAVNGLDQREQVTGFHMAGDIIGLDGLSCGSYSSDMTALEDTEVCLISYEQLCQLTLVVPNLLHHFHRLLSREIVRQNGLLLLLGSMHSEERIAAFLLNMSQRLEERRYSRSELVLRMSRGEIASYLGLKLETVSRVFSRFTHDRLIQVKNKHIIILDFAALRRIVGGEEPSELSENRLDDYIGINEPQRV